jgi:hypothetical protein
MLGGHGCPSSGFLAESSGLAATSLWVSAKTPIAAALAFPTTNTTTGGAQNRNRSRRAQRIESCYRNEVRSVDCVSLRNGSRGSLGFYHAQGDPGRELARDKPAVRSTLCFTQGSRLFFDSRFISLHALFRAPLHADGRQYGRAQLTNYRIPSEPP